MVVFGTNCADVVEFAEIAVGQCVEPDLVTPWESVLLCATIPLYGAETITVRSEHWLWQQTLNCTPGRGGRITILTLYCDTEEILGDVPGSSLNRISQD